MSKIYVIMSQIKHVESLNLLFNKSGYFEELKHKMFLSHFTLLMSSYVNLEAFSEKLQTKPGNQFHEFKLGGVYFAGLTVS